MKKELFKYITEDGHAYTYETRKKIIKNIEMPKSRCEEFLNKTEDYLYCNSIIFEKTSTSIIETEIKELEKILKEIKKRRKINIWKQEI